MLETSNGQKSDVRPERKRLRRIYKIVEGSLSSLDLCPIEKAKIECAKKLFNEMSTSKVVYHEVKSYQDLLNVMNGI